MSIQLYPARANDYYSEVAAGNIPGHSLVHKFGRNDGVPNGSFELVSMLSTTPIFLTQSSAVTMRVAAGHANDDTAGSHATEITVNGLDSTGAFVEQSVATAGASASSNFATDMLRVYRAWVSGVGTYGNANNSAVAIEDSGGASNYINIAAGAGKSEHCAYTIPLNKTGYMLSVSLYVDASKAANFVMYKRESITDTSAPMSSKRTQLYWDGVLQPVAYIPKSPMKFSGLTDVWIEAAGGGAGTEVSADMEILLVDD